MNFSAILDISSFFIGMIINLLLIALICYYFKRKYENLEIAQNEQAKVLYQLIQQNSKPKVMNLQDILGNVPLDVDIKSRSNIIPNIDSDSDSDSELNSDDSESDLGFDSDKKSNDSKMKKTIENLNSNSPMEVSSFTVKKIVEPLVINVDNIDNSLDRDNYINIKLDTLDKLNEDDLKDSYSKMTIKQLKDILSVKGINTGKLKKNEIIDLIEKSSINIDEQSK